MFKNSVCVFVEKIYNKACNGIILHLPLPFSSCYLVHIVLPLGFCISYRASYI
jgi:hypothetical protein